MSKVSEEGFLFIHSGVFDKEQIELNLKTCVKNLSKLTDIENFAYHVNVVENKDGVKYGHTYAWINNPKVYYALIGKNFDGTERVEFVPDETWSPPEKDYDDAIEEAEESENWGLLGEVEAAYERPNIKIIKDPLIVPPGIKYTETQKKKLEIEEEVGFIEIFPARVTIRCEEQKINSFYSSCIPNWVTQDILYNFFKKFNKDTTIHICPRTKKKFSYPRISISKNKTNSKWRNGEESSNVQIIFSPLNKNIGYFLINVIKKIKIKNPQTNREEMLFFSQSKSRT